MRVEISSRGFEYLEHQRYPEGGEATLASQSSAIGHDNLDRPGTSFLWIGPHAHLDRSEVRMLVAHLRHWLDTGYLTIGRKQERTV